MTNLGNCVNHAPLIILDLFVVNVSILIIIWIVLIAALAQWLSASTIFRQLY